MACARACRGVISARGSITLVLERGVLPCTSHIACLLIGYPAVRFLKAAVGYVAFTYTSLGVRARVRECV